MRKIIYALLVLLPLCGTVGLAQANDGPATTTITVSSPAGVMTKNSYNFGTVKQASVTKKFTIRNTGTEQLLITSISILEPASGFELVGNNTCLNQHLTKLARCQFSVKYIPQVATFGKTKTATIVLEGNIWNNAIPDTNKIKLTAKDGLRPIANFSLNRGSNSHANKNGVYNFNFGRGNNALSKTIYLRNTGNTPLMAKKFTLTDTSNQWQLNSTNCEKTVPVNKYCALILQFIPHSAYYRQTTESSLVVKTNDPVKPEITAKFKIINNLKPTSAQANTPATTYETPAVPVGTDINNCPGECFGSEANCIGMGRTVDRAEAHRCQVGSSNVCCVKNTPTLNEPPLATPPAAQACPGDCIASETGCMEAGKTIDRSVEHRCTTWGYTVCCVTTPTKANPPPTAHSAFCGGECARTTAECTAKSMGSNLDTICANDNTFPVCCTPRVNTPCGGECGATAMACTAKGLHDSGKTTVCTNDTVNKICCER